MSFESLHKDVLLQVAEDFAVDAKATDTKPTIIAALIEDGVTWDMYKESFPDVEPVEEVKVPEVLVDEPTPTTVRPVPKVLVKMERVNPHFEIRGYTFSKTHPFVPVSEDDANYIISNLDGFRIAMPSEAESFYS